MDIRRLEYFLRIAELGSLSRAALVLRISQPSLSRQMRILQEEVGVTLFRRHRRGMELTQEGAHLHKQLVGPIRQIGLAIDDARSLAKDTSGTVVIGMPSSISYILAGPLTARVVAEAPGISLRIQEGFAGHLLNSLDQSEIDVALLYDPEPNRRWSSEDLLIEEFTLAGPGGSGLSPDTPVRFEDLWQYPLILPAPQYQPESIRGFFKSVHDLSGHKLQIRVIADSFHHSKGSVIAGLGYSLMPISAFSREFRSGEMTYAPVCDPAIRRKIVITTHPGSQYPRAATRVIELIHEEVASLVASGAWPEGTRCLDTDDQTTHPGDTS